MSDLCASGRVNKKCPMQLEVEEKHKKLIWMSSGH